MIVGRDSKGVTVKSELDVTYSVKFVSREFYDGIYSTREFTSIPREKGCAMITGKGLSGYFYIKENPLLMITVHDKEPRTADPCNIIATE